MSELDKVQDELRQIKNRLQSTIDSIAGNHWVKDKNGFYIEINLNLINKLGITSKDIIGKTDYDLPWSDAADLLTEHDDLVMSQDVTITREELIKTNNEGILTFLVTKSPLKNPKGEIIGTIGTSIDITERKKLETQLSELKTREAHFKAMSSIGGMMAHELRTPLSAIAVGAQNLKKYLPILVEAYQEYSKISDIKKVRKHQLDYINELSDDIEQSARYASNTISTILAGFHYAVSEIDPIDVIDVGELIQQALSAYPLTREQKALITFHPKKNCRAMGVPNIVIHVLHNLIKNALYAIKEVGKGKITITLESSQKGPVKIIFKDTGKGISEEIMEHIFEPFYTTKGAETSIGLGLYFCKMALEKMEGSITCDSQFGEHTTFVIKLKGLLTK